LLQLGLMGINLLGVSLPQVGGSSEEQMAAMVSGGVGLFFGVIGLIVAGIVGFGAMRMMQLRSWGLSLAVSILAMIPCISPCCLMGIPIGIWALVVLNKPEVRAAFTA
jgi:predicted lysophospholipase L1 biosynthesis ABC-type transport system permease subunit